MSVIAVYSDGTRCCMACDSQASNGGAKAIMKGSKIVERNGWLFGAEGSPVAQQAIEYDLSPASLLEHDPLAHWAAVDFYPWLYSKLKSRGQLVPVSGRDELPGQILIARKSEFVLLDTIGAVVEFATDFWAIGSGGAEARGAMYARELDNGHSDQIVSEAVAAACALDDGCSKPIHFEWSKP